MRGRCHPHTRPRALMSNAAASRGTKGVRLAAPVALMDARGSIRLRLAERSSFGMQASLLLWRNRGVEPSREVPAEGAAPGAALTNAFRRAATASAGRIMEALEQLHTPSLGGNSGTARPAFPSPPSPRHCDTLAWPLGPSRQRKGAPNGGVSVQAREDGRHAGRAVVTQQRRAELGPGRDDSLRA